MVRGVVVAALLAVTLGACEEEEERDSARGESLRYARHHVGRTTVFEFWLPDGTRCVKLRGYDSLACQWPVPGAPPPPRPTQWNYESSQ